MELHFLTPASPFLEQARQLYIQAFPACERRDGENMIPESPLFRPAVLREGQAFCGILFYWEGPELLFLEHFAIAPQKRNAGLGAKALALLKELGKPIVLEIEPPEDALTCRRKGFYGRSGFRENPWQHIQPKYRFGDAGLPLALLSYPKPLTEAEWQRFEAFLEENVAWRPR